MYIVLGVLVRASCTRVTILSTLPSAGVGALLALLVTGHDLDIIGIIGIVLLIGNREKNAIMMIDSLLEAEREHGKPPREAIYQACLLRFRPILMTTMAALLGALPLMLGTGAGSELRRPLGIAIAGGLIVSQMLTLFTHAGHLPRVRFLSRAARGPASAAAIRAQARARPRRRRCGELTDEPVASVHRAPGRHDAARGRHRARRHVRVREAAGGAAAASRLSDDLDSGDAAGCEPGDGGRRASRVRSSGISARLRTSPR